MPAAGKAVLGALAFTFALGPPALTAGTATHDDESWGAPAGLYQPEVRCTALPDQKQARRRPWRAVLGWLYRYTRNVDIERTGGAPQPFVLRSPLLTAVPDHGAECEAVTLPPVRVERCAVLAVQWAGDGTRSVAVPLPQFNATTAELLHERIRDSLVHGKDVVLKTFDGSKLRLDADKVRLVRASVCRLEA